MGSNLFVVYDKLMGCNLLRITKKIILIWFLEIKGVFHKAYNNNSVFPWSTFNRFDKTWAINDTSLVPDLFVLPCKHLRMTIGVGYTAQTDLGPVYRDELCWRVPVVHTPHHNVFHLGTTQKHKTHSNDIKQWRTLPREYCEWGKSGQNKSEYAIVFTRPVGEQQAPLAPSSPRRLGWCQQQSHPSCGPSPA